MVKYTNIYKWLIFLTAMTLLALAPTAALAQLATPIVVVNTYRLNVRSGPSAGHDILTTVAGGTELPVTMLSSDRKWYQVTSSVGPGWLHSAYAVPRGDFSNVPRQGLPSNLASGTNVPAGAPHVVVNTAYLNIRTGPGVGHNILTIVKGGTALAVTAIDSGGVWYQVETSAGTGWLNRTYTAERGNFSAVPRTGGPAVSDAPAVEIAAGAPHLVVNTAYLNVRTGPGAGHNILTTVRGGAKLPVLMIASGNIWYQVQSPAGVGWVNRTYTVTRGNFSGVAREGIPGPTDLGSGTDIPANAPHLVVNTAYLNVRSGPGAGHSTVTVVKGGAKLLVTEIDSGGVWYKVETSAGPGWVNSNFAVGRGNFSSVSRAGVAAPSPLEGAHLSGPTPRAVVNTARLNIRSGPGVGYSVITDVPGGTTLEVLGMSSGRNWYKVQGSFGQGWLNNHYVVFRGDFSRVQVVS